MIAGSRLRELRKSKGLSRRELAEMLQIGEANIQRYENEEGDSTSEIVTKIARFFNVSTDYLLGLAEKPAPFAGGDLTVQELAALSAWRRGDYREAIKVIVCDD